MNCVTDAQPTSGVASEDELPAARSPAPRATLAEIEHGMAGGRLRIVHQDRDGS